MTNLAQLIATVRHARTARDLLRLLDAADLAADTDAPDAPPRTPDRAPRPSVVRNRAQLRAADRHGVRAFAMQWHGEVPPIWEQLDGAHFDVLLCTRVRAARARHAASLNARAQLHDAGTPCAAGIVVCACAPRETSGAHGPAQRAARRRARRADAARAAQLYRTARALTRAALPAPPRAAPCAGRSVASMSP